ncbi:protease complex subunit PrcB family protein [Flavobacterium sp. AG291]|uniref:protease complex subunit PrcB family protein n=1 Tax=Flavobacterium sp. AG291 TaxID=2184000 RepID=UPI000E0AC141|nr:protease complex subunit PrcB family protein [Flavobacterium sp. AG291]RDI13366.1 protease stability complex PrcB-like protein [Flavobacterium sp. AG291]
MKKVITFCLMLMLLSSCSFKIVNNIQVDAAVAFEILKQDAYGGRDAKSNVVVKSREQLAALYKELGWSNVPTVDFSQNNVVAIFMGQKNTGGYSVSVRKVTIEDNTAIINTIETKPEGMATMALTAPYCIVVVAKTDKVVVE